MPASRNQLLARLHCLKKEHGWDDDTYRDILFARTGKRSAGDLDGAALARLVSALGGPAKPRARASHEWSFVDGAATSRRPLLRKLIMLMKGTAIARGKQVAYVEGIARQMSGTVASAGPVEKPLPMCDEHELWRIVQAVAVHVKRLGKDPNAVDG